MGGVANIKARLTTVAVDYLRPYDRTARCLKRTIILCSTLQVPRIVRCNREALELQRRKPLVEIEEVGWYGR